jgi:hypothetical protein
MLRLRLAQPFALTLVALQQRMLPICLPASFVNDFSPCVLYSTSSGSGVVPGGRNCDAIQRSAVMSFMPADRGTACRRRRIRRFRTRYREAFNERGSSKCPRLSSRYCRPFFSSCLNQRKRLTMLRVRIRRRLRTRLSASAVRVRETLRRFRLQRLRRSLLLDVRVRLEC